MPQLNDLSRSLVALDQDSTIIAVVELSQSSWLVAGVSHSEINPAHKGRTIGMLNAAIWPTLDYSRVPYRLYHDPEAYQREQERIFRGPTWNYLGLEAEVPNPGDFRTTYVGDAASLEPLADNSMPE